MESRVAAGASSPTCEQSAATAEADGQCGGGDPHTPKGMQLSQCAGALQALRQAEKRLASLVQISDCSLAPLQGGG